MHGAGVGEVQPGARRRPRPPARRSLPPGESEDARTERMKDALPIGRVGTLAEAASAVLRLASPEAGFAVGHDLVIDGGATA
ncbi:SDR family oxidoreductase [Streptosporangium canum]|uniref:SDR family oxidoreductase n=1 Tax=Streptosporangium canum TaxID=324952 RepID=UPI0033B9CCBE